MPKIIYKKTATLILSQKIHTNPKTKKTIAREPEALPAQKEKERKLIEKIY